MDYSTEIKRAKDLLFSGSYNLCSIQCGRIFESGLKQLLKAFLKTANTNDIRIMDGSLLTIRKKSLEHLTLGELNSVNEKMNALRKMFNKMHPDHPNKMELDYLNLKIVVLIRNRAAHDSIDDMEEEAGTDAYIIYGSTLKFLNIFNLIPLRKSYTEKKIYKDKAPKQSTPRKRTIVSVKPNKRKLTQKQTIPSSMDQVHLIDVCKNERSGKYFIRLENVLNEKARLIGPDGIIRTLDTKLFEEKEEMDEEHLLSKDLITIKQSNSFHLLADETGANLQEKKIVMNNSQQNEPEYIHKFRKMMNSPDTIPSLMLKCIKTAGEIRWKDLKNILINKYNYKASGSFGASLRLLEIDGYIEIDGKGEDKTIR